MRIKITREEGLRLLNHPSNFSAAQRIETILQLIDGFDLEDKDLPFSTTPKILNEMLAIIGKPLRKKSWFWD